MMILWRNNENDDFRFNNASTYKGHLHQNGTLTWLVIATAIIIMKTGLLKYIENFTTKKGKFSDKKKKKNSDIFIFLLKT